MDPKPETSDYAPSKAPETSAEAEEQVSHADPRLIPGGAEPRTHADPGMSGMDRENVPSLATDSGQSRYRDTGRDEVTGK